MVELALKTYQTDNVEIALRRIGKGICPKSFPVTPQSFYFLDLYGKTHGGDYGNDLTHLPLSGGILDQPNIFFSASDAIASVRARHFTEEMNERENNIQRQTASREGLEGAPKSALRGE